MDYSTNTIKKNVANKAAGPFRPSLFCFLSIQRKTEKRSIKHFSIINGRKKAMKHLIREIGLESTELQFYFDGDTFTEKAGDFCYTLFLIQNDGYGRLSGLNIDEYKEVKQRAGRILDGFNYVDNGGRNYDGSKTTYKQTMEDENIRFNPTLCARLRKWSENADENKPKDIAAFLTITTGRKWETSSARGYCQGDYADIVYCTEFYTEQGIDEAGDIWMGCAKEFCVTDYESDDDEEGYTVYGYIVADCQARTDEDYKRIVCDYAGINPAP